MSQAPLSSLPGRPTSHSIVRMTEMVLQTHINAVDSIFGGVIMSWIDIAAAISASRHSGRSVVTASVDDLDFVAPVYKGWIVNLRACVNFTGRTSMEIGVRVDAENPIEDKKFHTASAYLTFVAVDSNGKPVEVPPVIPETEEEKRRYQDAQIRRQLRLQRRAQFARDKSSPTG